MARSIDDSRIYDKKEVADLLDVSVYSIMRYYRAGKLNGQRVGSTILFIGESIKEFLRPGAKNPKKKKLEPGFSAQVEEHNKRIVEDRQAQADAKAAVEIQEITEAMTANDFFREDAAKQLKISMVTLNKRMKKYGLSFPKNLGHARKRRKKPKKPYGPRPKITGPPHPEPGDDVH